MKNLLFGSIIFLRESGYGQSGSDSTSPNVLESCVNLQTLKLPKSKIGSLSTWQGPKKIFFQPYLKTGELGLVMFKSKTEHDYETAFYHILEHTGKAAIQFPSTGVVIGAQKIGEKEFQLLMDSDGDTLYFRPIINTINSIQYIVYEVSATDQWIAPISTNPSPPASSKSRS